MSTALQFVVDQEPIRSQLVMPAGLTQEQHNQVIALTESIRIEKHTATRAILNIAIGIKKLKENIPETSAFLEHCQNAFGYSKSNVYRLLSAATLVQERMAEADGHLPAYIHNISMNVFKLLGAEPDLSDGAVEAIKQAASRGTLTKTEAEALLAQAREQFNETLQEKSNELLELQGTLQNTTAQLQEAQRHLAAETARADRNEINVRDREATIRRKDDELNAMLQDLSTADNALAELRARPTEIQYEPKIVPEIPAGYTTIEEAIAAATAKRDQIQQEIEEARAKLELDRAELEELRVSVADAKAAAQTIDALTTEVDQIILKFPAAAVQKVTSAVPEAQDKVNRLALSLRSLADVLTSGGDTTHA
jgi:chromosome segregation ATPase